MSNIRKPAAFKMPDDAESRSRENSGRQKRKKSKPTAIKNKAEASITVAELDPFVLETHLPQAPETAPPARRGMRLGLIFTAAAGAFLSLATGLWVDNLIESFFARSEWLGWAASGLAAIAVFSLLLIAAREVAAVARLRSVASLQQNAARAISSNDRKLSRRLIDELIDLSRSNPRTSKGRSALEALDGEIIDGADLIGIAERELFGGLDEQAKDIILQSAKRVSVITAVSPRALIDIVYVLFESGRLIRRISELYGGRPGFFGFVKLVRSVATHLAVTGSIAVGDSLVQQIVGHGLAAKLSTRLGEGVVNGMMTVRIGIAAMETSRPLPFTVLKRPGIGEFLSSLAGSLPKERDD